MRFNSSKEIQNLVNSIKDILYGVQPKTSRTFNFIVKLLLTKIWTEKQEISIDFDRPTNEILYVLDDAYHSALTYLFDVKNNFVDRDRIFIVDYSADGQIIELPEDVVVEIAKIVWKYQFLINYKTDIVAEFFETFLTTEYKQEKGQFFTHPNIVRLILELLNISTIIKQCLKESKVFKVLDPSCGSGTFLTEIIKSVNSQQTINNHHWAKYFLYGIDIERDLVLAAKLNMIIHGDGSTNIFVQNILEHFKTWSIHDASSRNLNVEELGLTKTSMEMFDAIVSNPPFSVKLTNIDNYIDQFTMLDDMSNEKDSEVLFIERYYQMLKPGGVIGVILPESVLDKISNKFLREFLLTRFKIKAIVSLPAHAFEPYASQHTNILVLEKLSITDSLKMINIFKSQDIVKELKAEADFDYKIYLSKLDDIGFVRTKQTYRLTSLDQINSVINEYHGFQRQHVQPEFGRIFRLSELLYTDDFRLDVKFHFRNKNGIPLTDIVNIQNSSKFKVDDVSGNIEYVETGSIDQESNFHPVLVDQSFTLNNNRLLLKIRKGRIMKVPSNAILISPARPYQNKIGLVSQQESEKYFFSTDFIVLTTENFDNAIKTFLLLKKNASELNSVSRIGKAGYSKLRKSDLKYVVLKDDVNLDQIELFKEYLDLKTKLFELKDKIFLSK